MLKKIQRSDDEHPYRVSARKILALDEPDVELVAEIIHEEIRGFRHAQFEKHNNKRVVVEVGGLLVDCICTDVKVTEGIVQYQVKPIAGEKSIWVMRFEYKK